MSAAVNPVEIAIREGRFTRGTLPLIPGMDVAGVVEQTGPKAKKFRKGDAVYAYLSFQEQGGYAEFAVAEEDEIALKPKQSILNKRRPYLWRRRPPGKR